MPGYSKLDVATILEVTGSSISGALFAVTPTFDNLGSVSAGTSRRVRAPLAGGTAISAADYAPLLNFTTSSLAVGDLVVAVPILDADNEPVMAAVHKLT